MEYRKTITKEEKQEIKNTLADIIVEHHTLSHLKKCNSLTKGLDVVRKRVEASFCNNIKKLVKLGTENKLDIRKYRKFINDTLTKSFANALEEFDLASGLYDIVNEVSCYCANCYDDAKMAMIAGTICNDYDLLCFFGFRIGKNCRSDYYIHEHT